MSTSREDLLSPSTQASAPESSEPSKPPTRVQHEPAVSVTVRAWAGSVYRWLVSNSFTPAWLPKRWQRMWLAYAAAVGAQVLAVALTTWLDRAFPNFGFPGLLPALAIVLVALSFGAGPSLLATAAGVFLIDYFIVPPYGTIHIPRSGDTIGIGLLVAVGVVITIVASRTERQRRQAEAVAREREAMLEAVPDALLVYNDRRNIVRINPAAQWLLGVHGLKSDSERSAAVRRADNAIRSLHGAAIPPEQRPLSRVLRGDTLSGTSSLDLLIETRDGREIAVNVSGAPVRDTENRLVGAAIVMRDLTEQRRLEAAARASERQFQVTFEQAAVGIALLDLNRRILRANQRLAMILGYQAEELTGRSAEELSHPADLAAERALLDRMMAGELSSGAMETRYLNKSGSVVWTNLTWTVVRDDTGAPLYFAAIVEDITARRALERRTHEALGALLAMAEVLVSTEGSGTTPSEGHGISVAQQLAELTCSVLGCRRVGITAVDPATEISRPIVVVGLSPEEEREWWAEQMEGSPLSDFPDPEMVARLRAGDVVTFDMSQPPFSVLPNPLAIHDLLLAPMRMGERLMGLLAADHGGVPHHFTDQEVMLAGAVAKLVGLVVERERLLQQREEARARALALHEANQRMNDFLGVASHELKTPVTSLKVNVQLAARWLARLRQTAGSLDAQLGRDVEPIRDLLERSDQTMVRLTRLVDDLLDVSRIRAGKLELRQEPCDLSVIVSDAVQEQRAVVAEVSADRAIALDLPQPARIPIYADADRIGQVVTNYLTNALKYSPPTAPVEVRVELADSPSGQAAQRSGRVARVSVRDCGPGLPPEEVRQIWQPFHRAKGISVQSGSGVGLGLGLFISRTIIERHGGSVGVESKPGEGSTFWFTLPLMRRTP